MGKLRIGGGRWKRTIVRAPSIPSLRPTSQFFRNTLFSVLQNEIPGAKFLDLFAGTGIVGLEAVSRGAAQAYLVEKDPRNIRLIRENMEKLGISDALHLLPGDFRLAIRWLKKQKVRFDVVFLDPPYKRPNYLHQALHLMEDGVLLTENGLLALKMHKDIPPPRSFGEFSLSRIYRQGSNFLCIFRRKNDEKNCLSGDI